MIDESDYKEPSCLLCGGKDFYYPDKDGAKGRIPVKRIIEKADEFYSKNDLVGAERHLTYWQTESLALNDTNGELSVVDELLGLYRKTGNKEKALSAVDRALFLVERLNLGETVSGATIFLNAATTLKAFGETPRALPLYEKTLAVYSESLDKNDERFAGFYNNYALALTDAREYEKAEKCYLKAIEIMKTKASGKPDCAISYINLATLYELEEKTELITDCLFTAFNLLSDENNEKNGYFAYVLEKCAPEFLRHGYKKIYDDMIKESKEIYERS